MTEAAPPPLRRAIAAATAALSGRAGVVVTHSETEVARVSRGEILLPMEPGLGDDLGHARGTADSAAFRMRHHDESVRFAGAPSSGEASTVFEGCEQARTDSLGALRFPGAAANLDRRVECEVRAQGFDRARDRERVPIGWTLRLLIQERAVGRPLPSSARRAVNLWRPFIEERAGGSLAAAVRAVGDQAAFGRASLRLISDLGLADQAEEGPLPPSVGEDSDDDTDDVSANPKGAASGAATPEPGSAAAADETPDVYADGGFPTDSADTNLPGGPGPYPAWLQNGPRGADFRYRVFTAAHDAVVDAASLADAAEMAHLRLSLDQKLRRFQTLVARLANRLQRRLLAKQRRSWEFDLEEGVVDAARLAEIVANPEHALPYKQEREIRFRDTVVTLLLDNSGSMRGRPITVAALCADILARTLERCGVKTEVLGFTTGAWKGGSCRGDWVAAGKPRDPGRLNDLLHVVYKSADEPLRRARRKFGLMLREGLLKENIDGEALAWAHWRLLARPEQRRILMVISDGAPVDDSTLSANPANYLDRHLRQWIDWIETRSPVELVAIGIGHDVARYYGRAATIVDTDQLGSAMMEQLAELFDEPHSSATRH